MKMFTTTINEFLMKEGGKTKNSKKSMLMKQLRDKLKMKLSENAAKKKRKST